MNNTVKQLKRALESSQGGMQTGKMLVHQQYVIEALHIIEKLQARCDELKRERDELAAHVDRLRECIKPFSDSFDPNLYPIHSDHEFNNWSDKNTVTPSSTVGQWRKLHDVYNKTPQQSLAEHDAEVARKAFIDGASWSVVYCLDETSEEAAERYVQSTYGVKDGE